MKPQATVSTEGVLSHTQTERTSETVHRSARYQKVLDGRKQPIRGLWTRNNYYVARITLKDHKTAKKVVRWVPLKDESGGSITTVGAAKVAFRRLLEQRDGGSMPILGRTPKFADFLPEYWKEIERLNKAMLASGNINKVKRPATIAKEEGALRLWQEHLGDIRLNEIDETHLRAFVEKRQDDGVSNRTIQLDLIALRNVLKYAIKKKHLKVLPKVDKDDLLWTPKKRGLISAAEIDTICRTAFEMRPDEDGTLQPASKNAQQFADYIRLMAYSGGRRDETLRLKWADVNWDTGQLTIGSDGLSKNGKPRVVDFNQNLEKHLREMQTRRAPDSDYLFPSPQRGDRDVPAKTFKESLNQVRKTAGLPNFNFHDLRHFFISFCVMAGVDYMTIAEWVGHQDGGILIGKVYGHLADEHRKRMAKKVVFGPVAFDGDKAVANDE